MSVTCFQGSHLTLALVFGIPALLLFVAGPPMLLFGLLRRAAATTYSNHMATYRYLFLYHSYVAGADFWEVAKMLYITALVVVNILGWRMDGAERMGLFQAVVLGYMLLVLTLRPNRFGFITVLETVGHLLVLATSYSISFGTIDEEELEARESVGKRARAFPAALVVCSVALLAYLLLLLFLAVRSLQGRKSRWFSSMDIP